MPIKLSSSSISSTESLENTSLEQPFSTKRHKPSSPQNRHSLNASENSAFSQEDWRLANEVESRMRRAELRETVKTEILKASKTWLHKTMSNTTQATFRIEVQRVLRRVFLETIGVELSQPTLEEITITASDQAFDIHLPQSIRQWMNDP